ncbi:MAG: choice-of-anchor J domain-containing protein [Phycisphaerales bacterium]|nr:choice-of-anchor J domain-containing protein [Phycisphaerales bacterium]MCB9864759.1 choice-of-anchor J domain-containing protein [Phycisphaerales bacterium]
MRYRHSLFRHLSAYACVIITAAFVSVDLCHAQGSFIENFEDVGPISPGADGPANLIASGWIFRDQSASPPSGAGWQAGCCWGSLIAPLTGTGYMANVTGTPHDKSNWAILPPVANQQPGDRLILYTISSSTSSPFVDRLQVRYSPSGGTSTGSNINDVGNFTTLLLDISSMPNYNSGPYDGWTRWEVVLPGSGRIALRQYGTTGGYFGIDAVGVNVDGVNPPPPPSRLYEGFDTIQTFNDLLGNGWIFRSQNESNGQDSWLIDNGFINPPQDGVQSLSNSAGSDGASTEFGVSSWIIFPSIPDMVVGDYVSFWYRSRSAEDRLELRISSSGGTNTGTGFSDVGDFVTPLLVIDRPTGGMAWERFTVQTPSTGRFAFRRMRSAPTPLHIGSTISIDSVSVAENPPELPCNLPPLPAAGETVTWTTAESPYEICFDVGVPEDSTVNVEPGVVIMATNGARLTISGTLNANGTAANPIQVTGTDFGRVDVTGRLAASHTEISTLVKPEPGARMTFADCQFFSGGSVGTGADTFQRFDRCSFLPGSGIRTSSQTVMRDCTFTDPSPAFGVGVSGYLNAENVTISGAPLEISRQHQQPLYLDGINVADNPTRAGIEFSGNLLLGPNNVLQGNDVPVRLTRGGLLPGSTVPAIGNTNNYIGVGDMDGGVLRWADTGVPYVVEQPSFVNTLSIDPGVNVKFAPGVGLGWTLQFHFEGRGLPDAPIVFGPLVPDTIWGGLEFWNNDIIEYCVFRGADIAVWPFNASVFYVNDCIFDKNTIGVNNSLGTATYVRNSLFHNNDFGYRSQEANGDFLAFESQPNSFAGNILAVRNDDDLFGFDAAFNWWGDATGPQHLANPDGQGDEIGGIGGSLVNVVPFLTEAPTYANHPPVVRWATKRGLFQRATKLIVSWTAFDDDEIVEQRILWTSRTNAEADYQLIATLPPNARNFEWTIPSISSNDSPIYLRIAAIDSTGKSGFDEITITTPNALSGGSVEFTTDLSQRMEIGQSLPLCYDFTPPGAPIEAFLLLDGDETFVSLGAVSGGCAVLAPTMPAVSTDRARFALTNFGGLGDWYYSDYFEIRPNALAGDAAPSITMLTPLDGDVFVGGGIVPISWTASDDEALRSFDIQVSFDGGRYWTTIARDLPNDTTTFNWSLPASSGVADVRARVVARDLRFQNSADGDQRSFSILPGDVAPVGDIDGDGDVDLIDAQLFVDVLLGRNADTAHVERSDLNADSQTDGRDISGMVNALING